MSKVLITGAAGLLGNHLSRHLLNQGHDVIGIDNLSGGYVEYVDDRLINLRQFLTMDLLNREAVDTVFKFHEPEVVFHFAAYAALGLSPFIRNFNYSNNILASVNVINACINNGTRKMIFASSMDVYGDGYPPFNEDDDPHPIDPYGIAKFAVELDLQEASDRFGLKYNIIRPHNVIGVYQNIWDKYRNVIGIWIRQILNNQPITVFGDGEGKRAFSDIKYILKPMEILIDDKDNEIYNLGSDKVYTIIEAARIVKSVAKSFGYDTKIVHLEPRDEVRFAYCDHGKAMRELKFKDKTNLKTTVKEMFEWAMKEPNREVIQKPYEINKDMYGFWK